jgi:hypothetical protein
MNRDPVPGIALRETRKPVLARFPLVNDRNHKPGNTGRSLDHLIAWFRRDKRFRNGGKIVVGLALAQRFAFVAVRALRSVIACSL